MSCPGCGTLWISPDDWRFVGTVAACSLCAEAGFFGPSDKVSLPIVGTDRAVEVEAWWMRRYGVEEERVVATLRLKGESFAFVDKASGGPALKRWLPQASPLPRHAAGFEVKQPGFDS